MPIGDMIREGTLSVVEAERLDYTPDQFALAVAQRSSRRAAGWSCSTASPATGSR